MRVGDFPGPEQGLKGLIMSYTIRTHPATNRLFHITIEEEAVSRFLRETKDLTEQRLTSVPYLRSIAAAPLQQAGGPHTNLVRNSFFEIPSAVNNRYPG